MATVYKVEVISHSYNYTEKQLEKILQEAIDRAENDKGNKIEIIVKEKI